MGGYPRPLSDWGMRTKSGVLVNRVDAAFIWAHNGKTYLFSEGEFWRFDESRSDTELVVRQPDTGYPKDNSLWEGMPYHVDDIMSWGEGNTLFLYKTPDLNKYVLEVWIVWHCIYCCCCSSSGDAYFFKDNFYWVIQKGSLNQAFSTPKSIAVDWLRCPASPENTPGVSDSPNNCKCNLGGAPSLMMSSWLLLMSLMLVTCDFLRSLWIFILQEGFVLNRHREFQSVLNSHSKSFIVNTFLG